MTAEFSPVFLRPAYDFLQHGRTKRHENLTNDSENYAYKFQIYGGNRDGTADRIPANVQHLFIFFPKWKINKSLKPKVSFFFGAKLENDHRKADMLSEDWNVK